ncbi:MFS transporter [Rhizobium lentis]|uniref:MFS transporter n=1 Tax=Rhizobium lentis TaxID=1138194 RepID=UPI001C840670|nr:MFS transporter [Rhizobium lentis]MBX5133230.1 MFS transporter [Rhizobium lentis]MBX5152959.1 MFS transporter [Rhizobium lentis]MBX5180224.1 MFS transporter [Rhizobium lentis]
MTTDITTKGRKPSRAIPGGVWALGFVSLFMDVSSEMIHGLLPVYMVTVLGASALSVGVIEGIAEATAAITKVFSGAISDWFGRRKLLVLAGYGMAALTKPVFPLAPTIDWLVAARFIDRVGKGIRGAPRDALIADITAPEIRGASFGLRQSLDTVGAFLGPALALVLMWWTSDQFATVFWIAVIPAFVSVGIVLMFVKEPSQVTASKSVRIPLRKQDLLRLPTAYWLVTLVAAIFTLARFSEAFLLLDTGRLGLPVMLAPLVLIGMNLVYALSAYPVGILADRFDRVTLLLIGIGLLIAADLVLAFVPGFIGLGLGVLLWGLHMGSTQGVFAALVADTAPADLRGTAFGAFNLVSGVALLLASVVAGALWEAAGPAITFAAGAAFAALAGAALLVVKAPMMQKS